MHMKNVGRGTGYAKHEVHLQVTTFWLTYRNNLLLNDVLRRIPFQTLEIDQTMFSVLGSSFPNENTILEFAEILSEKKYPWSFHGCLRNFIALSEFGEQSLKLELPVRRCFLVDDFCCLIRVR